MRTRGLGALGLGLALALATPAAATPSPKQAPAPKPAPPPKPTPSPTWADWVGDYRGALTWRGCTAPGAASAAVALDATDAVMSIELAPLGGGLRAMSLVEEAGGWSAQQGDVTLRITRGKPAAPDALELLVSLDSGCTVRGRLARAASGVPACDRLAGWSRIEARCGKLSERNQQPLEDAAAIAKTRWRAADAASCAARASRLELALIDAGCAPHPDPAIGHRAPDCLRLADDTARVSRCKRLPPNLEAALVNIAASLRAAAETADRASLPLVEQQCRDERASLASFATRFGCPL